MILSPRKFCEEQGRLHLYYLWPNDRKDIITIEKLDELNGLMEQAIKNIITSNISCKKKRKHSSEGKLIRRNSEIIAQNRSKSLNHLWADHVSYNKLVEATTDTKNLKLLWKFLPKHLDYHDLISYIALGRIKFGAEALVRLGIEINIKYPPHRGNNLDFVEDSDRYGTNPCYVTFYNPDGTSNIFHFCSHNYCILWFEMKDVISSLQKINDHKYIYNQPIQSIGYKLY